MVSRGSNNKAEYGIAIGSNYVGVLNEAHYAKLKALFCPNEDAKWYLDTEKWKWRREYPSAAKGEYTNTLTRSVLYLMVDISRRGAEAVGGAYEAREGNTDRLRHQGSHYRPDFAFYVWCARVDSMR